jgi:hypothetical protein
MLSPEPNPHLKLTGSGFNRVNGGPAHLNRGYLLIRLLRRACCASRAEGLPESRFLKKNREWRLRLRLRRHSFGIRTLSPLYISRDYVMNSGLSLAAMGRVGRPFQGRRREEARRQARIDRARAGTGEQVRFTISVEKYSTEWSLIEPQKNRSEFIRECVRKYPTFTRRLHELQQELAVCRSMAKERRAAVNEVCRLRDLLEEHSIDHRHIVEGQE